MSSDQRCWYVEYDDRYGAFDCEEDHCSNLGRYLVLTQHDVIMLSIDSEEAALSVFGEDAGMFVCEDCFEEFRGQALLIEGNSLS